MADETDRKKKKGRRLKKVRLRGLNSEAISGGETRHTKGATVDSPSPFLEKKRCRNVPNVKQNGQTRTSANRTNEAVGLKIRRLHGKGGAPRRGRNTEPPRRSKRNPKGNPQSKNKTKRKRRNIAASEPSPNGRGCLGKLKGGGPVRESSKKGKISSLMRLTEEEKKR